MSSIFCLFTVMKYNDGSTFGMTDAHPEYPFNGYLWGKIIGEHIPHNDMIPILEFADNPFPDLSIGWTEEPNPGRKTILFNHIRTPLDIIEIIPY